MINDRTVVIEAPEVGAEGSRVNRTDGQSASDPGTAKKMGVNLKAGPAFNPAEFTTLSGVPIQRLYTQADLPDFDYDRDLGDPGDYPYTRGIHRTLYRGKLWTMRQFSGFGSPEDTNARL